MGIPDLDEYGLLPPGVWDCTLEQCEQSFCTSPHREGLWDGLVRFLEKEARPLGAIPLWINGSFTRRKDYPEDIDVVLDLSAWERSRALGVALSFFVRHDELKLEYHVDAWTRHPALPNDLAAYFRYAGEKCAAELRVDQRHSKGILRVQL